MSDIIARLYSAAADYHLHVLDELMLKSGLMWPCDCGTHNREDDSVCSDCGTSREGYKVYTFQFRREQRVDFEVVARNAEEAEVLALKRVEEFDLTAPDDCSDDRGELELLEDESDCDVPNEWYDTSEGNAEGDAEIAGPTDCDDPCPVCGSTSTAEFDAFAECYSCGTVYNERND